MPQSTTVTTRTGGEPVMSLLDRVRAAADCLGGPLAREDRPRWKAAQSLEDLGELTAQWLEGRIASQPGYYGSVDVDEDDAPGLTDTLIALNRAGLLTNGSQAGYDGPGFRGSHCVQLAAVDGFASQATTDRLRQVLDATGYELVVHECKHSRWGRGDAGVDVTYLDGQPVTHFGQQLGRATIAGEIYAGCSAEAIDAVCGAKQVTVYDPVPGRNTMWPVLREAADQHLSETGPAAAPCEHAGDTRGVHVGADRAGDDDTDGW